VVLAAYSRSWFERQRLGSNASVVSRLSSGDARQTANNNDSSFVRTTDVGRIPRPYPTGSRMSGMEVVSGRARTVMRMLRVPTRCFVANPAFLQNLQSVTVRPVGNASSMALDDFQFVTN